jgi:hypothetical protein
VNGVPLKRVNQAYVIATSTKVDISALDVVKYSDGYFKREVTKKKKGESQFFEAEKEVRDPFQIICPTEPCKVLLVTCFPQSSSCFRCATFCLIATFAFCCRKRRRPCHLRK